MGPSLALVVLKTRQPDQVKAFYECLGIQFRTEKHGNGPIHFAGQAGQSVLEVYPLREGEPACDSSTRLGFQVNDAERVLQALEVAGTRVVTPATTTPWGYRTVVQDPDERPVELYW